MAARCRPGDGERAIFRRRRCPRMLYRRRQFCSKRLFFGAHASEAVRQLSRGVWKSRKWKMETDAETDTESGNGRGKWKKGKSIILLDLWYIAIPILASSPGRFIILSV